MQINQSPKIFIGLGSGSLLLLGFLCFLSARPKQMVETVSPTTTKLVSRRVAPHNADFLRGLGLLTLVGGGAGFGSLVLQSQDNKDDEELLLSLFSNPRGIIHPELEAGQPLPLLEPREQHSDYSPRLLTEASTTTDDIPSEGVNNSTEVEAIAHQSFEDVELPSYQPSIPTASTMIVDEGDKKIAANTLGNIFLSAAISPMSLVIAGESNVGKSTFLKALMYVSYKFGASRGTSPSFIVSALKLGNYLGIQKREHGLFLNNIRGEDFGGIKSVLELTNKEYERRSMLYPEDDPKIQDLGHYIGVYDDFTTLTLNLMSNTSPSGKQAFDSISKWMPSAYTLYRSHLVRNWILAHTYNVKALLLPDASIRDSLEVIAVGRQVKKQVAYEDTETSLVQGGFKVMQKIISNPHLMVPGQSRTIQDKFDELRPIAEQTSKTLLLSSIGGWKIGFAPENYFDLSQKTIIHEEENNGTPRSQQSPIQSGSHVSGSHESDPWRE